MCVSLSKKETLCCLYVYNAIWYLLDYLALMFYVLTIPNEKTYDDGAAKPGIAQGDETGS